MNEEELKQAATSIRTKIAFLKAMVEIVKRNPKKHEDIDVEKLVEEIQRLEKVVRNK